MAKIELKQKEKQVEEEEGKKSIARSHTQCYMYERAKRRTKNKKNKILSEIKKNQNKEKSMKVNRGIFYTHTANSYTMFTSFILDRKHILLFISMVSIVASIVYIIV